MEGWTEVSKKRKANSPIVNKDKESRKDYEVSNVSENTEMDFFDHEPGPGHISEQGADSNLGLNPSSSSRRTSTASGDSFSTVTSRSTVRKEKPVRKSVFVTKKPEGAFRDELVVELQTLDGKPFKGKITIKEARRKIFQEILGFRQEDLASLLLTYSSGQIALFKLKQPFNIDTLEKFQYFDLERPATEGGEARTSILKCKVRGIRTEQRVEGENYTDSGMRWVKLEGCEFRVDKEKMIEWLSYFGEIKSEVTEDTLEDSDDSADDFPSAGNGIYSVKVKIARDMPQFLPIYGKRVRLYYRGIIKRCTNCFHNHQRKNCRNEKVSWQEYVRGFAEIFPEIPKGMYGKWAAWIKTPTEKNQPLTETTKERQQESVKTTTPREESEGVVEGRRTTDTESGLEKKEKKKPEIENEDWEEEKEHQTEEEKVAELVRRMLATGVSTELMESRLNGTEKQQTRKQNVGRGRGKGTRGGKSK